ncbi:hypothetical protein Nepgr_009983 [Nepenthes gracilis]|uniref:DNA-(apurinic or apyrimidinic site) endonuclease n=1 Tax=Nepenthes gracilis TaxID=150966 RepID=A0AAD3XKM7_NEPGR|nr:hypothetical protein Nepgr_009983 [Nepenthes gracilis]
MVKSVAVEEPQLSVVILLSLLCRFAVFPKSLNVGALFSMQARAIGSAEKDKKSMASMSTNAKGNGERSELVKLLSIKDDLVKLGSMTIPELRTALRSFGASTKGRKHELVSTLKCLLDSKVDGESYLPANEASVDADLKSRNVCVQESIQGVKAVSEASGLQQRKRITKKVAGEGPHTKRRLVSETASGYVKVSKEVGESVHDNEPWTKLAHKKPQKDWIAYNPRTMRPPALSRDAKFMKLMSWNVNGLRALLKSEGFSVLELAQREDFDVLCLQETKLKETDVESVKDLLEGYENSFWTCSISKLGYAGSAIISRIKPLSVNYGLGISDHDGEGRLVTAEFDSFYLLSGYIPNSGDGLKRLSYRVAQWDPSLCNYMKELEKSKPVILAGDLNCAHQEIDIYDPAGNRRSAGFTVEERQSFEMNFLSKGFVDTYRKQHPGVVGYTYWGYRHGARKTNKGWRLDYFLVSESIAAEVYDSYILPDINGSDHCPIGLILKL